MKQWLTYIKKSIERCKQIIDAGFTLIEMRECEWLKFQEYKNAIKTCDNTVEPLNPRNTFYGGRTNVTKLKVENKILRYIDVL
jgi:hypothetical protein